MTLPPLSGQALLQGKQSPTSATNNSSSKIEGWKMPLFLRKKDMKKVLLWLPTGICNFLPERKKLDLRPLAKQLRLLVFITREKMIGKYLHLSIPIFLEDVSVTWWQQKGIKDGIGLNNLWRTSRVGETYICWTIIFTTLTVCAMYFELQLLGLISI